MNTQFTVVGHTTCPEDTKRLGAALAAHVRAGDIVVLNGDLGAGKTQFVQGVAEALGINRAVTSPTFNILLTYDCQPGCTVGSQPAGLHHSAELDRPAGQGCPAELDRPTALNHFDLYRLEDAIELEDIGYWEVLEGNGVSFIEWGDKFPEAMPDDYLELKVEANAQGERSVSAQAHGPRSEELLAAWF